MYPTGNLRDTFSDEQAGLAALEGPIQNDDLLWPEAEGRDGLEQLFDDQLKGEGWPSNDLVRRRREEIERADRHPAAARFNVVDIHVNLQRLCEETLEWRLQTRGARSSSVIATGYILAMASYSQREPKLVGSVWRARLNLDVSVNDPSNPDPAHPRRIRLAPLTFRWACGNAVRCNSPMSFPVRHRFNTGNPTSAIQVALNTRDLNFIEALTQSYPNYQVGQKMALQF